MSGQHGADEYGSGHGHHGELRNAGPISAGASMGGHHGAGLDGLTALQSGAHHLAPLSASLLEPLPVGGSAGQQDMPRLYEPTTTTTTTAAMAASAASTTADVSGYKSLNVKDAHSYLVQVKQQFSDQPEVYNRFLDIMKEFKAQTISTPGVIDRVSTIFRGHPALIMGFNTFLPPGYRIESTNNPDNPICVITPQDQPTYYSQNASFTGILPPVSQIASGFPSATGPPIATTGFTSSHEMLAHPPSLPPISALSGSVTASVPTTIPSLPQTSALLNQQLEALSSTGLPGNHQQMYQSTDLFSQYPGVVGAPQMGQQGDTGASVGMAPPKPVMQQAMPEHRAPVEFNHAINYVNKIKNRFANEPNIYKQFLEILQTYQREQKPIQEVYSQVQVLFNGASDLLQEFKQFLPDASGGTGRLGYNRSNQGSGTSRRGKRTGVGYGGSNSRKRARTAPFKPIPNAALDKSGTLEELDFFDKVKTIIGNRTTYNEFLKILNLFSQELIDAKTLIDRVEPFLSSSTEVFEWFKKFVRYEEDDIIYNVPADRPELNIKTCRKSGHSYRLLPSTYPRPVCSGKDDLACEVLNEDWISHPVYVSETGFVAHKKTQFEEAMFKCEEERYDFDINIEANLHTIALLEPWAKKLEGMTLEEKAKFRLPRDLGGFSTSIFQRVIKKIYDRDRGLEVIDAVYNSPAIALPVVLKRLKQKDEEWKRSQREWNRVWRELDAKNCAKSLDHQGIYFKTSDRKNMGSKSLVLVIETLYKEQKEGQYRRSGVSNLPTNRYQFDFAFKDAEMFPDATKVIFSFVESSLALSPGDEAMFKDFVVSFSSKFFHLDEKTTAAMSEGESTDSKVPNDTVMTDADAHEGALNANGVPQTLKNKSRPSYSLYANTPFYVFFRLYQMLYSRLQKMKQLSDELIDKPAISVHPNPTAIQLGFQKELPPIFVEKDRYTELLKITGFFLMGEMDATDFEDRCRAMFGTSAYYIYTIDKLVQSLAKQVQFILTDAKSLDLLTLFKKDREKTETSSRQEAVYRLSAESLMQDESMIRLEYFTGERVLTMQLLGKEDHISDDSFTAEEKWSFYVDQFVQLSTNAKLIDKAREPFLKRSLPATVSREPPSRIVTRSGLELKICMNTYKIFFVEGTEDYFYRKQETQDVLKMDAFSHFATRAKAVRADKFGAWMNGPSGWRMGLTEGEQAASLSAFSSLRVVRKSPNKSPMARSI